MLFATIELSDADLASSPRKMPCASCITPSQGAEAFSCSQHHAVRSKDPSLKQTVQLWLYYFLPYPREV